MFPRELRNETKAFLGVIGMTVKRHRRPILRVQLGFVPEGKFVPAQYGPLRPTIREQNSDTICCESRVYSGSDAELHHYPLAQTRPVLMNVIASFRK